MKDVTVDQELLDSNPELVTLGAQIGQTIQVPETDGEKLCDKTKMSDPHYGEDGDYTSDCKWVPSIG